MSNIKLLLESQNANGRANEVAYKFTIQNIGNEPISVLDIINHTPEKVSIRETRDYSSIDLEKRRKELCVELSSVMNEVLRLTDPGFAKVQKGGGVVSNDEVFTIVDLFFPFHLSDKLFRVVWREYVSSRSKDGGSDVPRLVKISDSGEADNCFRRWFPLDDKYKVVGEIFMSNVDKLKKIESEIISGGNIDDGAVMIIEKGGVAEYVFVYVFNRYGLEVRPVGISVSAIYCEVGGSRPNGEPARVMKSRVNSIIVITPSPANIALVSVLSSALGVWLRNLMLTHPLHLVWVWDADFLNALNGIDTQRVVNGLVASAILSLVLVNIYEYTDIGKQIKNYVGISWQGAMLIGLSCGMAADKLLNGLNAILGR